MQDSDLRGTEPRESEEGPDDYAGPRSPLRVLNVVEILAQHQAGLTLSRLGSLAGVPKTSLLSILRVLERPDYVRLDEGRYTLGQAAFRLGFLLTSCFDVAQQFKPEMADLSRKTCETVMISVLDRATNESLYLDMVQPDVPIRFVVSLGARRPLHCTAVGLALLSFQSDAFIDTYLRLPLERFTPDTVTDPEQLRAIIRECRNRGYAFAARGKNLTAGAIAAPIYDRAGAVSHCISANGPAERLEAHHTAVGSAVRDAARRLSRALGYPGPYPGPADAGG